MLINGLGIFRAFRERREKYIRSLETTVDNYKGLQSAYKNLELRLLDADQRMEALRGENAELLKERERMTQSEFTTFKECVDMFRHENTQLRNTSLDLRMLLDVFRRGGPTDSVGRGMEEAQPTSQPIRFQPLELAAAYSGHPVSHAPTPLPIHLPQIGNYASSNHPFYPVSNLRHPHHPQHSYIDQQVVPGPRKASYTSQLNHYSPYPQHQPTHFKSENLCNLRSP